MDSKTEHLKNAYQIHFSCNESCSSSLMFNKFEGILVDLETILVLFPCLLSEFPATMCPYSYCSDVNNQTRAIPMHKLLYDNEKMFNLWETDRLVLSRQRSTHK